MRQECRECFSRHRHQRKPLVNDYGMHHGTCVTQVPWCMSGSLIRGGGETFPAFTAHPQPAILRICLEAHNLTAVVIAFLFIIPHTSTKLKEGYTGVTLSVCPSARPSVCPSVRLWTESCPLCIFNNTHRIYFTFAHLIKQLQKVCPV